jgi:EAL domain-containing protein (putative c-di-GMP-specific phosphodiesterase class I)
MLDIQENANSKLVVEALVHLGQRLGKQVVIEGIETQARFEWARTMEHVNCQRYYISAPYRKRTNDGFVATHGLTH